eukprot:338178_1
MANRTRTNTSEYFSSSGNINTSNDQHNNSLSESATLINISTSYQHNARWNQLYCHWIAMVVLMLDHFTVMSAIFIIVPLYTQNETITGYLIFLWGFTNLFTGFFAGSISQKYGCIFILIITIIVRSTAYLLLFFCYDTHQYAVWYISLALLGTSQNFSMQGTNMYSSQYIPNNKLGRFNSSIMAFRRLSYFIGSLIAGYLIYNDGIKHCIFIIGIISCFALVLLCTLITPPNYWRNNQQEFDNDSFTALKNSYRDLSILKRCCNVRTWIVNEVNIGKDSIDESIVDMDEKDDLSFMNVLRLFYKRILLITLYTFGLTYARTARRIIITFQGQYIGLNAKNIGFVNAISYIPDSLLFPVAGYIMDNFGRKYNAILCITIFTIAFLWISFCNTFDYLIYNALLWGVADGVASGLTMTMGVDLSPIKYRNQFYSIYRMFENISGLVAPIVVGYLSNEVNIRTASYVSAVFTTISLLYALVMTEPKEIADKYQLKTRETLKT